MAETNEIAARAVGKRISLPGYFAAPVAVEAADALGALIFLRVRTEAGTLEEVPVDAELIDRAIASSSDADARLVPPEDLFLVVESTRIRLAYAFDPYFAVSLSGIRALPHQLEAVYERMLPQARLRFLLAHDPGAGKTIMAGLLIKELKLRGALDRVLIVSPAPLTIQWQDEMRSKFEETFEIVTADLARNSLAGNAWDRFPQVITSLDFAKQPDVAQNILRTRWDLVVIDEAHKCSAQRFGTEIKKTRRYEFAEALSRETDRLLLMTATPHQGNRDQFELFLRLLDEDQFVGLSIDRELITLEESPWFSRRIKEDLRDFDGRRLFTKRIAVTQGFELRDEERELYIAVTDYINQFLPRQTGRRKSSVALARTVLQRRLASSLGAIEATLTRRRDRLADVHAELDRLDGPRREQRMRELRLVEIVDDEYETDDEDPEAQTLAAVETVVAIRMEDIRAERDRLNDLLRQVQRAREAGEEAKLAELRRCLERAEFGELKDGRGKLLIFTEYRATQEYLVRHLESWGYSTCVIHGQMDAQRRKDAQAHFQRDRQICVATEAAGEGINLQFCHLMINYDIPWNPNRLEQRMGRIHRIGQKYDVAVFNFAATNTVEGAILVTLLRKLDEIRAAMGGSDRVFDVIGPLLQLNGVNLEEMLREAAYNPTSIDAYEAEIERLSPQKLLEYEEATGIALAARQVDLDRIRPKDWRSEERRLMPEFVERFFVDAASRINLRLETRADGLWRVDHVPQRLRAPGLAASERYGPPATEYKKLTFRKEQLAEDRHLDAELLSPGHPLYAATVEVLETHLAHARQGTAAFVDAAAAEPYRLHFYETRVLGELPATAGRPARSVVAHAELAVVREGADGSFSLVQPDVLHDLTAVAVTDRAASGSCAEDVRRAERWLQVHHVTSRTDGLREDRRRETEIRRGYLERSFYELIKQRRAAWTAYAARVAAGEESFRLAREEAARTLDETERRRDAKLAALGHLEVVRPGPAVYLGSALVRPVDDERVRRVAVRDDEVEAAAVRVALAHEASVGWTAEYVGDLRDGSGFDIRSAGPTLPTGERPVRRIEVKGRSGGDATVMLTPNEWTQAIRHGETYWLYVVTEATGPNATLLRVQDPARGLERQAERLTVVKGWVLPASAIEAKARKD